jgi:hypothetical protein
MGSPPNITTDHDLIRTWVEERGGQPTRAGRVARKRGGTLQIRFDDEREHWQTISWDDFFRQFDAEQLAFVYQEGAAHAGPPPVSKLVRRARAT